MNRKKQLIKYTLSIVIAMGLSSLVAAQDFSRNWRFIKQAAAIDADTGNWETVSIPHTWNALDAQNGGGQDKMSRDGYYRGPGSYAKEFVAPAAYLGKRVFLRFEAVSSVAQVYLNGTRLGEHKGAFGAFTFEITDVVKYDAPNTLRVLANNQWDENLPPLAGDFPIFGGIYRPVHLFAKEQICLSPLRNGSHGVFLRQEEVTEKEATLQVAALISNAKSTAETITLSIELMDEKGETVQVVSQQQQIQAESETECQTAVTLLHPHLWDGLKDPYLYTVKVTITENDQVIDSYSGRQGFRFFAVDGENGFLLNGKPYQLWGVNRHQDHENLGWAITKKEHDIDLAIIREMGARAIRLAHYPHAEYFYQRCDELGILVTAELPLVDLISESEAFYENTAVQMNEIIDLHGNYTCVFAYGLHNEMYHKKSPPAETLLMKMHALCKKRDPSRFTYGGTNQGPDRRNLNATTELLAFNGYPGWYGGASDKMGAMIDDYLEVNRHRGIAISEYGAGASIKHQETYPKKPEPGGKWHPEGYQALHHEVQFSLMKDKPGVWGTFIWNLFDFSSVWRDEGDRPGINDKGLVTHDRRTRKDAFYFYKANWNTAEQAPVLYITVRRHLTRTEMTTPVKVYSNVGPATLFVNGKKVGTKTPGDMKIIQWEEIELKTGENTITVQSGSHTDSCTWIYRPKADRSAEQKKL